MMNCTDGSYYHHYSYYHQADASFSSPIHSYQPMRYKHTLRCDSISQRIPVFYWCPEIQAAICWHNAILPQVTLLAEATVCFFPNCDYMIRQGLLRFPVGIRPTKCHECIRRSYARPSQCSNLTKWCQCNDSSTCLRKQPPPPVWMCNCPCQSARLGEGIAYTQQLDRSPNQRDLLVDIYLGTNESSCSCSC